MKRPDLNFIVDACAFGAFTLLASTGLLLKFLLPPGSGALGQGGGVGAAGRPVLVLWGLTRHEWGEVHFWIAAAFIAILAVHLFLHGAWIVSMMKRRAEPAAGRRGLWVALALLAVAALAAAPFLSPVRQVTRAELSAERAQGRP